MKTTTKRGFIEYVSKCDSVHIEHNDHIIMIDKEKVTIHVEGVQYAQYWMIEHESDKRILPFVAETKRYRPESQKMHIPHVQVYLNALADNFINFWRGLLK